jgi:hypothetical protein
MKRPDSDVICHGGLGMPGDHTRAIPQLEALEFVFPLGKQRVSLRNGLFFRKTGKLSTASIRPPRMK